jgi:hypothetical protein
MTSASIPPPPSGGGRKTPFVNWRPLIHEKSPKHWQSACLCFLNPSIAWRNNVKTAGASSFDDFLREPNLQVKSGGKLLWLLIVLSSLGRPPFFKNHICSPFIFHNVEICWWETVSRDFCPLCCVTHHCLSSPADWQQKVFLEIQNSQIHSFLFVNIKQWTKFHPRISSAYFPLIRVSFLAFHCLFMHTARFILDKSHPPVSTTILATTAETQAFLFWNTAFLS